MRARDDDHGAEIARFALSIRRRLDLFVEDKDEGSWFEVEVMNGGGKTAFEVSDNVKQLLRTCLCITVSSSSRLVSWQPQMAMRSTVSRH